LLNRKFAFVEQATTPIAIPTKRLGTFCRARGISAIHVIDGLGALRPVGVAVIKLCGGCPQNTSSSTPRVK
jgi:hypothetical protein